MAPLAKADEAYCPFVHPHRMFWCRSETSTAPSSSVHIYVEHWQCSVVAITAEVPCTCTAAALLPTSCAMCSAFQADRRALGQGSFLIKIPLKEVAAFE